MESTRPHTGPGDGGSPSIARIEQARRWPVRFVGLLLVLQGGLATAVAVRTGWRGEWPAHLGADLLAAALPESASTVALLGLLGVPTIAAGIGFLFVRPAAWPAAMALQALTLAVALAHHVRDGRDLVHVVLAYAALLVFPINSRPVRTILHGPHDPEDDDG